MPHRKTDATHSDPVTTSPPPPAASALSARARQRFTWRLLEHCSTDTITVHSKRKRRRLGDSLAPASTSASTTAVVTMNDDIAPPEPTSSSSTSNKNVSTSRTPWPASILASFHLVGTTSTVVAAYLVAAALFILSAQCAAASPCDSLSWWDPVRDKCIDCTICQGELIPLRPCQLHRDTICGSIYDLKIDWVVLAKTEPNWKERRKSEDGEYVGLEQQLTHEQLQQLHEESLPLDWQTGALFLAVLACLLFFIVAACILIHHMRQWRRMERRLDQDVEELSTKLMAKLAEVQSLEGGTFFIGTADALRVPTTFQPQHVLLPEKPGKHHDRRILKALQPGNVYIEENGSKG